MKLTIHCKCQIKYIFLAQVFFMDPDIFFITEKKYT